MVGARVGLSLSVVGVRGDGWGLSRREKRCDPPLREGRSDGSQIYVGGYVGGYVITSNLSLLSAALHPAPNAGENTASGCLMISS